MFLGPGVRKFDVLLDDVRVLPGWRARLTLLKEHLFPDAAYMRRTYAIGSSASDRCGCTSAASSPAPSKWFRRE